MKTISTSQRIIEKITEWSKNKLRSPLFPKVKIEADFVQLEWELPKHRLSMFCTRSRITYAGSTRVGSRDLIEGTLSYKDDASFIADWIERNKR